MGDEGKVAVHPPKEAFWWMAEPSVYGDIKGKRKRNSYRPDSSLRAAQTLGVKLVMRLNEVLNEEAFKKPLALAISSWEASGC